MKESIESCFYSTLQNVVPKKRLWKSLEHGKDWEIAFIFVLVYDVNVRCTFTAKRRETKAYSRDLPIFNPVYVL